MSKLINAIPEEKISEELDCILKETINTFVENEKYRIPVLNNFKREIDFITKLIGERTMILIVSIQNSFRCIHCTSTV